jgi:acyl-CoA synthetase (NDP forming)
MYLEGIKKGRHFLQVLKKVASKKPVVIWKGGRTEEGGRAIASHTASLAVSQVVWEAAIRQCGGINVKNMPELVDALKILLYISPVFGDRVGLVGGSGGQSVAITDTFAETNLKIPLLSPNSYEEFSTFFTLVGGSFRNPIDNGNPSRMFLKRIVEILERDEKIDNLVVLLSLPGGGWQSPEQLNKDIHSLINIRRNTKKPLLVIIPNLGSTPERIRLAREALHKLQKGNIPVFSTLEQGAKALRYALDYYAFRKETVQ